MMPAKQHSNLAQCTQTPEFGLEIESFYRQQAEIYSRFMNPQNLLERGTTISPFARTARAGYVLHIEYDEASRKEIAAAAVLVNQVISSIQYSAAAVHLTLLSTDPVEFKDFRRSHETETLLTERTAKLLKDYAHQELAVDFLNWWANSDTVILGGNPRSLGLVRFAIELGGLCKTQIPNLKRMSMAHCTLARFKEAVNDERVEQLLELLPTIPVPAPPKSSAIALSVFRAGPNDFELETVSRFTLQQ